MLRSVLALTFVALSIGISAPSSAQPEEVEKTDSDVRTYTLVFARDGQTSKGDVTTDDGAKITGKARTVVSTGENGLKVLQGTAVVEAPRAPVNVVLDKSNSIKVASGSKLAVQQNADNTVLSLLDGEAQLNSNTLRQNAPLKIEKGIGRACPAPDVSFLGEKQKQEPIRLIATEGTQFGIKEDSFELKKGNAFVELPADTKLLTPAGSIESKKPYIISYRMVDDYLCLENCTPIDAVDFEIRGEHIKLEPFSGCALKHCDGPEAQVPDDGLFRRNVVAKSDGQCTVMISEYDPQSLLESHAGLNRALKHPITAHERAVTETLFKGIAVFQDLCGNIDEFEATPKTKRVQMLGYFKNPLRFGDYELLKKCEQRQNLLPNPNSYRAEKVENRASTF